MHLLSLISLAYSYDPAYTDDSEVVVLQGSVGSGTRSIEFGESTVDAEDWDVISFDGLDSSVSIDLSQVDSNYDATATSNGQTVAYVDGAEGVFGTNQGDSITGDAGRNILHGGEGADVFSGGEGQDLISGGAGADSVYGGAGEDILIDIEGGDAIFGDGSADGTSRSDDTFVVGQGTNSWILIYLRMELGYLAEPIKPMILYLFRSRLPLCCCWVWFAADL